MGNASIFSGSSVKTLKSNLDLNGAAQILTGSVNPTSTATNAKTGSLYLNTSSGAIYKKNDDGNTTNWSPLGSSAIPTLQTFTSGSGTYTTPSNVAFIRVRMVGGGGGGGGIGAGGGTGGTGGSTTFGSSFLTCAGGTGGGNSANGGSGGAATISIGSGIAMVGNAGGAGFNVINTAGGMGAAGPWGGSGLAPSTGTNGADAAANSGAGGGGAPGTGGTGSAGGGGAGGYIEIVIANPAASYAYSVGAGGTAGVAGFGGLAGGAGGSGFIIVDEFYAIATSGGGGSSGITRSINSISTNTTLAATALIDYVYLISGTTTATLPTAVGNSNRYTLKNVGSGTVTINTTSSQTIDGSTSIILRPQYASIDLISDNSNWAVI